MEKAIKAWSVMMNNWEKYMPPGRPSADDVENYKGLILSYRNDNLLTETEPIEVLVLGSTPEIRKMLNGFSNANVTIVDRMLEMMMAMTELMNIDTSEETWIRGDWLKVPLKADFFDIVISDLVTSNMPVDLHDKLYSKIEGIMKKGGRWLNRIDCIDENSKFINLDTLLNKYAKIEKPTQKDICFLRCEAGLYHWSEDTKVHSWEGLGEEIKKYRKDGKFVHENPRVNYLLEGVWDITAPFDKPYWLKRKEEIDGDLKKHFNILSVKRDMSVLEVNERGYYIYNLERKKQDANS